VRQQTQRLDSGTLEKVQSVTNELFKYIVYYPIFDVHDEHKVIAIFEVGYKKHDKKSNLQVMTTETQHYLDQFRSHLDQFRVRLSSFCRGLQSMCTRRLERKASRLFQVWKNAMILA